MKYRILLGLLLIGTMAMGQNMRNSVEENNNLYEKGKKLYNASLYEEAINIFDELLNDDPYYVNAYLKKFYSYYYSKKYDDALNVVDYMYQIFNKDNRYFYMKAQVLDKQKQYGLAERYLNLAILFDQNNVNYYKHRSGLRMEMGKYENAIMDYDKLIFLDNTEYSYYYYRGLAKYNLKQKKEACVDWDYGYLENESCKRYYFYKCTKENIDGLKVKNRTYPFITKPEFIIDEDSSFTNYIAESIIYPLELIKNEEEGTSIIKFTLTKDLELTNINILYSTNILIDSIAIDLVKNSKMHWKNPAYQNDTPVDMELIVPITLRIDKDPKKIKNIKNEIQFLLNAKKYIEAIELSELALKSNPFNFEIYKYLKTAQKYSGTQQDVNLKQLYTTLENFEGIIYNEVQPYNKAVKFYFNNIWDLTSEDSACYYRIANWSDTYNYINGEFKDYTIGDKLVTEGSYSRVHRNEVNTIFYLNEVYKSYQLYGKFKIYHLNGNLKQKICFVDDQPTDTCNIYYENGVIRNKIVCKKFEFDVLEQNDSSGIELIKDGKGLFEYKYLNYLKTDTIKINGKIKNYEKDDFWKFYLSGKLVAFDIYKKGNYRQSVFIDDNEKQAMKQAIIGSWIFIPFQKTRAEKALENLDETEYFYLYSRKKQYLYNFNE